MKNTFVKIIALVLVLTTLTCVLASCGGLSGKYESGLGVAYEFDGDEVSISVGGATMDGTYEIKDGKITFTFDGWAAALYNGTFDFEQGDDYIKIAGLTYTKK